MTLHYVGNLMPSYWYYLIYRSFLISYTVHNNHSKYGAYLMNRGVYRSGATGKLAQAEGWLVPQSASAVVTHLLANDRLWLSLGIVAPLTPPTYILVWKAHCVGLLPDIWGWGTQMLPPLCVSSFHVLCMSHKFPLPTYRHTDYLTPGSPTRL